MESENLNRQTDNLNLKSDEILPTYKENYVNRKKITIGILIVSGILIILFFIFNKQIPKDNAEEYILTNEERLDVLKRLGETPQDMKDYEATNTQKVDFLNQLDNLSSDISDE